MADGPKWCTICDMYYHDCHCDPHDNSDNEDECNDSNDSDDDDKDERSGSGGFLGVNFPYVPGDPFW